MNKIVVWQTFSVLHDTDNARLKIDGVSRDEIEPTTNLHHIFSLLIDSFTRFLSFNGVFELRRDRGDSNLLCWTGKVIVERKRVGRVYIPTGWMLPENLILCASERLQMPFEICFVNSGSFLDLLTFTKISPMKRYQS